MKLYKQHNNYSRIFVFVFSIAFGFIGLALGYKAMSNGTEIRSKASDQRYGTTVFTDVPVNAFGFSAIERIFAKGLTSGCSTNPARYCPSDPVTRATAAVFMVRAMHGKDFVPEKSNPGIFSDVAEDDAMRGYIEQLYRDGLTVGCGTNPLTYCPTKELTRADLAVFFVRAIHGSAFIPPTPTGRIFSDVNANTFAAGFIEQLYKDGFANMKYSASSEASLDCEKGPKSFCPQKSVSRAVMAVMLERYVDRPQLFSDVLPNHWAYSSIQRLYRNRITAGCSQSPLSYCPETPITRGQAAVMIVRAHKGSGFVPAVESTPIFSDVGTTHPFRSYIEELSRDGITTGCGGGKFCPDQPLTRGQATVFIMRTRYGKDFSPASVGDVFLDVPKNAPFGGYIEKFYTQDGLTVGCSRSPLRFCPNNSTTRAEMAIFLDRTFKLE